MGVFGVFVAAAIFLAATTTAAAVDTPALTFDGIVSVTSDNGTSLLRSVTGYLNHEFKVSMPSDARFMIGSNTKLFTTVAIYQLHEQGKLNVSADIATMLDASDFVKFGLPNQSKLCPTLPNTSTCLPISLNQLLSMSSGLYPALNCNAQQAQAAECNPDIFFVNPGSIGLVVGTFINNPLVFVPGTQYMYSNPNFVLAAYFVQKFSGMKFGAYLQKFVFDPAGLRDTYYDFFDGQLGRADPKRTYEYQKFYDNATLELLAYGPVRGELDTGAVSGTGGMISTPDDLCAFWRLLFDRTTGGAPLLKSRSSQHSILSPWTFVQTVQLPLGTFFGYYAQGTLVICAARNCPDGPSFINYEGGTIASRTANLYDYRLGKGGTFAQAWTSSNLYLTTSEQLQAAQAAEEGPWLPAISVATAWTAGTPQPGNIVWELVFKYSLSE